jgi:enoyl-CoA hydratase/carnithine racemase
MADKLSSAPPSSTCFLVSFPRPFVLLVTINRESAMNSIPIRGHWEGQSLWQWFDEEPALRVAVITGKGSRSFSAGADLIEQKDINEQNRAGDHSIPTSGFMGLSRRLGKKPVIAAVNGYALGGGFETCLNWYVQGTQMSLNEVSPLTKSDKSDLEAQRGLYAAAGGLPRVVRTFGMQLAGEIVLAGRVLSAQEVQRFGFSRISNSPESLIDDALNLADKVVSLSPDAVIVSRAGLRETWETASVERAAQLTHERYKDGLFKGQNIRIGLQAFAKKQSPVWVPSKL